MTVVLQAMILMISQIYGFRPIVCLNSDVKFEQLSNGNFQIISSGASTPGTGGWDDIEEETR